jgi:hypothetical protein
MIDLFQFLFLKDVKHTKSQNLGCPIVFEVTIRGHSGDYSLHRVSVLQTMSYRQDLQLDEFLVGNCQGGEIIGPKNLPVSS